MLVVMIAILIATNLPIIPSASWYGCDPVGGCYTHTDYQSFMQDQCMYPYVCMCACGGGAPTITLAAALLYSGTPSSPTHRGSGMLKVVFNNPGEKTEISSIEITSTNTTSIAVYECQSPTFCSGAVNLVMAGGSIDAFNSTSSLYFSQAIVPRAIYDYVFNFANGQSVSGDLIAQDSNSS
jgi:hypothetical protein